MRRVIDAGADAVVTKSIGPLPRKGNPGPILTASHGGLLNAVGLTNPGIDQFVEEMESMKRSGIPVVLSIFGTTIEELVDVARKGINMGPNAIELNLSCPHAEIGQISLDPRLTYDFIKAAREVVDCPLLAKITPNASDIVAIGQAAERAGADGVVAVNTVRAMKIDIYQKRPVLSNKVGGLSGPSIFPIAVRCIYDLYSKLSIPIIGVGGVSTWEDAIEMHLAGAKAIEIGTAVLQGIGVFRQIRQGVQAYLMEQGFADVSEIVGLAGRV